MTERSGSGQAPPATGGEARPARPSVARPPDRRHQRRWVPVAAGWLALLIGLADVTEGAVPGLYAHYRLHRIGDLAPGTLTNLTRTADVIIGLLLLMLSQDRKSTRLNSSHVEISYAVFCLKKKKKRNTAHKNERKNTETNLAF